MRQAFVEKLSDGMDSAGEDARQAVGQNSEKVPDGLLGGLGRSDPLSS